MWVIHEFEENTKRGPKMFGNPIRLACFLDFVLEVWQYCLAVVLEISCRGFFLGICWMAVVLERFSNLAILHGNPLFPVRIAKLSPCLVVVLVWNVFPHACPNACRTDLVIQRWQ